jgi:ubiquinone/menaquinone biosynthesis C-methylase UbiE
MSRAVTDAGAVVALDIQAGMLEALEAAKQAKGCGNVMPRLYDGTHFGLTERFDFVLMFWMFHEVRDKPTFLKELLAVWRRKRGSSSRSRSSTSRESNSRSPWTCSRKSASKR